MRTTAPRSSGSAPPRLPQGLLLMRFHFHRHQTPGSTEAGFYAQRSACSPGEGGVHPSLSRLPPQQPGRCPSRELHPEGSIRFSSEAASCPQGSPVKPPEAFGEVITRIGRPERQSYDHLPLPWLFSKHRRTLPKETAFLFRTTGSNVALPPTQAPPWVQTLLNIRQPGHDST